MVNGILRPAHDEAIDVEFAIFKDLDIRAIVKNPLLLKGFY